MTAINIALKMFDIFISSLLNGLGWGLAGLIFVKLLNRMTDKRVAQSELLKAIQSVTSLRAVPNRERE